MSSQPCTSSLPVEDPQYYNTTVVIESESLALATEIEIVTTKTRKCMRNEQSWARNFRRTKEHVEKSTLIQVV